jgi:hypothetical protein
MHLIEHDDAIDGKIEIMREYALLFMFALGGVFDSGQWFKGALAKNGGLDASLSMAQLGRDLI